MKPTRSRAQVNAQADNQESELDHCDKILLYCIWDILRQIDQAKTPTIFFSFNYVIAGHKKDPHQFSDFFENFSGSNG